MESILEMIQGLVTRFFGSSAMSVVQSLLDKIIEVVGSIFGLRLAQARDPLAQKPGTQARSSPRRRSMRSPSCQALSGPRS